MFHSYNHNNIIPVNLCHSGIADLVLPFTPEAVILAFSGIIGCISFSIFDDDLVESTEELTFILDEISSNLDIEIGDERTFVFRITDNDGK